MGVILNINTITLHTALLESKANIALRDCEPYTVEIKKRYWNGTVQFIGSIWLSTLFAFHAPVLFNR